ncbi:hypothetical protein Tco_0720525 [Tanacetum coccineum]
MLAIHAEEGEGSGQPSEPQPTPPPAQSFHEEQVLDLEKAMTAQAKEIAILKKRVKKLEKIKNSRVKTLQDWYKTKHVEVRKQSNRLLLLKK